MRYMPWSSVLNVPTGWPSLDSDTTLSLRSPGSPGSCTCLVLRSNQIRPSMTPVSAGCASASPDAPSTVPPVASVVISTAVIRLADNEIACLMRIPPLECDVATCIPNTAGGAIRLPRARV